MLLKELPVPPGGGDLIPALILANAKHSANCVISWNRMISERFGSIS